MPSVPSSALVAAALAGCCGVALAFWTVRSRRRERARHDALQASISQLQAALRMKDAQLSRLRERGAAADGLSEPLYRVVLTGGPCGGKTTALARIKARLEEFGFLVVTVPETATMLFSGGVPLPSSEASAFAFQKHLLRVQRELEEAFTSLARGTGRPAVVICDRGLMDGTFRDCPAARCMASR